jgi:hypothetical protein
MVHSGSFGSSSAFQLLGKTTERGKQTTVQRMGGFVESDFAEETDKAFEDLAYKHDEEEE